VCNNVYMETHDASGVIRLAIQSSSTHPHPGTQTPATGAVQNLPAAIIPAGRQTIQPNSSKPLDRTANPSSSHPASSSIVPQTADPVSLLLLGSGAKSRADGSFLKVGSDIR
jgi:hypothetical protein